MLKRITDRVNEFPLAETIRPAVNASFSPDGSWLVFASSMDGNPELYRINPSGAGLARLTNDPGSDIDPVWMAR